MQDGLQLGHALSLLTSEAASSAWLQLILLGLLNCGQSVFNFPLSFCLEVESEVPSLRLRLASPVGFGEMSAKCPAWPGLARLVPVGSFPAAGPLEPLSGSCHFSLGTNCKIDCWPGARAVMRGRRKSFH